MYNGKKVAVVMPAYNAAKTLLKTYREAVAQPFVDRVIVVDDALTAFLRPPKVPRHAGFPRGEHRGYIL